MALNAIQLFGSYDVACTCVTCGVAIVMPEDYQARRRNDKVPFFCLNGHKQYFSGKTNEDILRASLVGEVARREKIQLFLDTERKSHQKTYTTLRQTSGKLRAVKERIKNGVCPCCRRSFSNLHRHMSTQHPGFNAEPKAEHE